MRIFVSSLISGFGDFRASATKAVEQLGHSPVTAESFTPGTSSPRVACLSAVRDADLVLLILGESYGAVQQPSGLSATHEEYREAKSNKPVIAFVMENVEYDDRQQAFVTEVQEWNAGLYRGGFTSADELYALVLKSVHQFEVSAAATEISGPEMLARALQALPTSDRQRSRTGGPLLQAAFAGGPSQTILRPSQIEDAALRIQIMQNASYGSNPVFSPEQPTTPSVENGKLRLNQPNGACIEIDEAGTVRIAVPVAGGNGMLGAIIEENVRAATELALAHANELLERLDETHRLARIAIAVTLEGSGVMGWRTQAEDLASPNSMTVSHNFTHGVPQPVNFSPPDKARNALAHQRPQLAEDIVVLLRRQWT